MILFQIMLEKKCDARDVPRESQKKTCHVVESMVELNWIEVDSKSDVSAEMNCC